VIQFIHHTVTHIVCTGQTPDDIALMWNLKVNRLGQLLKSTVQMQVF